MTLLEAYKTLSLEQRGVIISELRCSLEKLRSYDSPWGDQICSVVGGPIKSFRVPDGLIGPLDEASFNEQLLRTAAIPYRGTAEQFDKDLAAASSMSSLRHPLVFTHGDLWHHNIFVHNGHLSAILDWETAGWSLDYWECTSVLRGISEEYWWEQLMEQMWEGRFERELICDRARLPITAESFPIW